MTEQELVKKLQETYQIIDEIKRQLAIIRGCKR
jgi:hypothetical protein